MGHSKRVHLPQLVRNPGWVDRVLALSYDQIVDEGLIKPTWVPKLTDLHIEGNKIAGKFKEYGCGSYGCVYPTLDEDVVLKVTTDDTEMEFAVELSSTLVAPVCVKYYTAYTSSEKQRGKPINLLWRESAYNVGRIAEVSDSINRGDGKKVSGLIDEQWRLASMALRELWDGHTADDELAAWTLYLDRMTSSSVEAVRTLADGMLKIYREQHIFFGDVHAGNLGQVDRDNDVLWVITDPGNIVVIEQ